MHTPPRPSHFQWLLEKKKKITIFQNTLYAHSVQEQTANISPIFWNCRNQGKVNNRYQTQLILQMHIRVICFLLKSIQKSVYSLQIWHVSKIQAYLHPSVSTGQIYLNTLSMVCQPWWLRTVSTFFFFIILGSSSSNHDIITVLLMQEGTSSTDR